MAAVTARAAGAAVRVDAPALAREALAALRASRRPAADHPAAGGYGSAEARLGLRMSEVVAVARTLAARLRTADGRDVLRVAFALVDTRTFEARLAAYELVRRHRGAREAVALAGLRRLGRGLDNWAAADAFACWVSGPAWRTGRVRDADVHAWARASDLWWRRVALASTVALNLKARGGSGDVPRTLAVCERLVADRDDLVIKAVSWALRSAIAHDPAAVRAFVARHGDALASRVRREVASKLATGLKHARGARA